VELFEQKERKENEQHHDNQAGEVRFNNPTRAHVLSMANQIPTNRQLSLPRAIWGKAIQAISDVMVAIIRD
jgi:hypothetical protein